MIFRLIAASFVAFALMASTAFAGLYQLGVQIRTEPSGGVLIQAVVPYSYAQDLGLEPGDVILAIDRNFIRSPQDLKDSLAGVGNTITVDVRDVNTGRVLRISGDVEPITYAAPGGVASPQAPRIKNIRRAVIR